jgi:hypothetical protein
VVFERHGEGWAEEIFPSVSLQRKQLAPRTRRPDQDAADAVTQLLCEALELPAAEATQLLDEAASWRTTRKGRSLIDRKLRKTVRGNVSVVLELFLTVYQLTPPQVREVMSGAPALLAVDRSEDWAGNYFEFLVRSRELLRGAFDREAAFAAAKKAAAAHEAGDAADGALAPSCSLALRHALQLQPSKPFEEWVDHQATMKQQGRLGEVRALSPSPAAAAQQAVRGVGGPPGDHEAAGPPGRGACGVLMGAHSPVVHPTDSSHSPPTLLTSRTTRVSFSQTRAFLRGPGQLAGRADTPSWVL